MGKRVAAFSYDPVLPSCLFVCDWIRSKMRDLSLVRGEEILSMELNQIKWTAARAFQEVNFLIFSNAHIIVISSIEQGSPQVNIIYFQDHLIISLRSISSWARREQVNSLW